MAEKARTSALCFVASSKSEPQFWKTKQQKNHNCMDIIYTLLLALGEKTTLLRVVTVYILPSWQVSSSTLLMRSNSCHHHHFPPPIILLFLIISICLLLPSFVAYPCKNLFISAIMYSDVVMSCFLPSYIAYYQYLFNFGVKKLLSIYLFNSTIKDHSLQYYQYFFVFTFWHKS